MRVHSATAYFGVIVVALSMILLVLPSATPASANATTVYVNNATFGVAGTCVPGDDSYNASTASANTCSLGAALTYANNTANGIAMVTLATDFAAAGGGTITPVNTASMFMSTAAVNSLASANNALYMITAALTVDLQNKLGIGTIGALTFTTIYINADGASLLNASNILSARTSIVVSSTSRNITIDGGTTLPSNNTLTQQFLEIQNGAQNVTFRNYTVGNLNTGNQRDCVAAVCFAPKSSTSTVAAQENAAQNILIDNVTFTATVATANNSIAFDAYAKVSGLEVTNSQFTNLKRSNEQPPVMGNSYDWNTPSAGVQIAGLNFHGNTVTNGSTCTASDYVTCSFIYFQQVTFTGGNYVQNNSFVNDPALRLPHAVVARGSGPSTGDNSAATPSNLYIQDNYFDGFTYAAVWNYRSGLVTVTRNTMGPNTYSNPTTQTEETAGWYGTGTGYGEAYSMFAATIRSGTTAPAFSINTWYPTSATMVWQDGQCQAQVALAQPTKATAAPIGNIPATPVTIDLYWTATTKAEKYLGSQSGLTDSPVSIPIPASFLNPDGTVPTGYFRVQTQSEAYGQLQSSQYSRTIATPTGQCVPVDFSVEKKAYSDPARTVPIPVGTILPMGTTVYFTYVLINQSAVGTTVVGQVLDSDKGDVPVCQNVTLSPSQVDATSCTWQTTVVRP